MDAVKEAPGILDKVNGAPPKPKRKRGRPSEADKKKTAAAALIDVLDALQGLDLEAIERVLKTAMVFTGLDGKGPL